MKKYLLSGLALLLPLTLTILIILFILNLFTKPFAHGIENWLNSLSSHPITERINPKLLHYIAEVIILIIIFIVITFVGYLARWFFMRFLLKVADKLLTKVPIVSTIYKTSRDIIKVIFSPEANSFKQVVMAPFPSKGKYCVGLVAGRPPLSCQKITEDKLVTVLLPTAPHPISGYLLMFKEKDLKYLDMSIEDAVKFTISCGIIHPEDKIKEFIDSPSEKA